MLDSAALSSNEAATCVGALALTLLHLFQDCMSHLTTLSCWLREPPATSTSCVGSCQGCVTDAAPSLCVPCCSTSEAGSFLLQCRSAAAIVYVLRGAPPPAPSVLTRAPCTGYDGLCMNPMGLRHTGGWSEHPCTQTIAHDGTQLIVCSWQYRLGGNVHMVCALATQGLASRTRAAKERYAAVQGREYGAQTMRGSNASAPLYCSHRSYNSALMRRMSSAVTRDRTLQNTSEMSAPVATVA